MTLRLDRLESFLRALPDLTIGLVGDLFLDRYLELEAGVFERSLETGLEAYQVARVRNCPGALGTVLNNLAALGAGRLRPVTVLGDDGHGYDLRRALQHLPVDLEMVLMDPQRLTPTYTKPLRTTEPGHCEELNRLDVRTRGPLSRQMTTRVCEALREVFAACAGVIVLDQVHERDWGVVNEQVRGFLGELARNDPGRLVFIDSRACLREFHFGVLKGNRREILEAGAVSDDRPAAVEEAAALLARRTGRPVFCTLGEEGMLVAKPAEAAQRIPGYAVSGPVDIVGAGDAASSGIVVSLLAGASVEEAAAVGNLAASITVQQLGTTGTASPAQMLARWHEAYGA